MANLILRKITTPDGTELFNYNKFGFKGHRDTILKQGVFMQGNAFYNQREFESITAFTITEIYDMDSNFQANFYVGHFCDFIKPKYKTTSLSDFEKEELEEIISKSKILNLEDWAKAIMETELSSR